MKAIKHLKQSKTVKKEALVMALGIITIIVENFGLFKGNIDPTVYGSLFILFSVVGYYLRTITSQPLDQKDAAPK